MQIIHVATLVVAGAVASWLSTAAKQQENNLGKSWRDGCQWGEWCALNSNFLDKKFPDVSSGVLQSFICSETNNFFFKGSILKIWLIIINQNVWDKLYDIFLIDWQQYFKN